MKIKTILFFLPLLLCGALFGESENSYLELEYDRSTKLQEDGDLSSKDNEPPIQGLFTQEKLVLKGETIILNQYLAPNSEITTESGIDLFFPLNDGIRVKKSGLYRISFFQRVLGGKDGGSFLVNLKSSDTEYVRRSLQHNLNPSEVREIELNQIVRLERGAKIWAELYPISGKTTLLPSGRFSGFTIEAISVN